jgi:TPR repeat protein
MGSKQSTPKKQSKVIETPIVVSEDNSASALSNLYPEPTGHEYDRIDRIAAELPHVIDDESRQQAEDFKQACDNGKGPVVACFATGEYLSLFERKHKEAADLYRNACFRPKTDKSINTVVASDGTKAYPAACYNLAKMLMTGKGGIRGDRVEAYRLFDRACQGDHGGACYLQAQILCSRPGALGKDIPHDPQKAIDLYQKNCDHGDSISCYTLATMLLRGDKINKAAGNVSPQEAQGVVPLTIRENEEDRTRHANDLPYVISRDPKRAEALLLQACESGSHVTSCHNLAVMYTHGDDGVPVDPEKAELFKKKTQEKMQIFGGF